ncbi:MAG: hypothetical protein R3258_09360 [Acidimicrobiia bacterium]|nr:hypothetical protein [Acidimicrobiia bacterium]
MSPPAPDDSATRVVALSEEELQAKIEAAALSAAEKASAKTRDSIFAEMRRQGKGKSETKPKPKAEPKSDDSASSAVEELRAEMRLRDAIDDLRDQGWSKAKAKLMAPQYIDSSPADPAQWVKEIDAALGVQQPKPEPPKEQPVTKQEPRAEAKPEPKPAPAAPGGAPSPVPGVEQFRSQYGTVDVFDLPADVQATMPEEELKAHFEKFRSVARQRSGAPPLPKVLRSAGN